MVFDDGDNGDLTPPRPAAPPLLRLPPLARTLSPPLPSPPSQPPQPPGASKKKIPSLLLPALSSQQPASVIPHTPLNPAHQPPQQALAVACPPPSPRDSTGSDRRGAWGARVDRGRELGADKPPWRQPRGKLVVSLVNYHTNATRIGWHLWEIDLRFAPGLPPGWPFFIRRHPAGRNLMRVTKSRAPPKPRPST